MCDRVLVMCKGAISGEFTREEASQEKIMARAVSGYRQGGEPGMTDHAATPRATILSRILAARELPTVVATLLLAAVIAIGNPSFLSGYNLQLLAKEVGVLGIMATGEMVVIITGGIDLSAGSLVAFTSVMTALGLQSGFPLWVVVAGVVLACAAIGWVHAFFVNTVGLAPFIITLGSLSVWRGVVLVITRGYPIKIANSSLLTLGQGTCWAYRCSSSSSWSWPW